MNDLSRRWEESRRLWWSRTQRYKGDPFGAAGVLRRRLASRAAGVDVEASVSLEYSLPVLQGARWLVSRFEVDETEFAQCPGDCPVNPPLSHVYSTRSNYILGDALVDTRSGNTYVDHLGRPTLIRESTSWPASQALWGVARPTRGTTIHSPLTILSSPRNYFHFMTEDFPALLRVLEMWPDVVVGVRRGPRPRFVDDALHAVDKTPLELDRVIKATTLHMAGRAPDLGYLRSGDQRRILQSLLRKTGPRDNTKLGLASSTIYASRGGATRSGLVERQASTIASGMGAKIVDFAMLDLFEQAQVCQNAETVIGSHGAALVNALFCLPGSTLIELLPPDYHNRCYEWLAHTCSLVYRPVYNLAEFETLGDDSRPV